jgi:hypothetical protein
MIFFQYIFGYYTTFLCVLVELAIIMHTALMFAWLSQTPEERLPEPSGRQVLSKVRRSPEKKKEER